MIVSHDSPLRRISKRSDPRQILYLDGIRYSVAMADLAFTRLEATLDRITKLPPKSSPDLSLCIVEAMADTWTFIDAVYRANQLVQQLPGLKQNIPEVQLFIRRTNGLEPFRHFVQHLRNGIDDFVAKKLPVWGGLSWAEPTRPDGSIPLHTIVPGTLFGGLTASSCVLDTWTMQIVDRIVLEAGAQHLALEKVHSQLRDFWIWFEATWAAATAEADYYDADLRADLKFEFKMVEKAPAADLE